MLQREKDSTPSKVSTIDLENNTYHTVQIHRLQPTLESKGFEVSKRGSSILSSDQERLYEAVSI